MSTTTGTTRPRRRPRLRLAAGVLAVGTVAAGVGLGVADSGPQHPAQAGTMYCSVWLDGVLHCIFYDPGSITHR